MVKQPRRNLYKSRVPQKDGQNSPPYTMDLATIRDLVN
jgi:hypothetical protein